MTQHYSHKVLLIWTLLLLILQGCSVNRLQPGDYEVYPTSDKTGCVPANYRLILNEDNTCQLLSYGHGSNEDSSSPLLCTWKRNRKSVALSLTDSEYNFSNSDDKLNAKGKIEFRDFDYTNYDFLQMEFKNKDTVIYSEYNLNERLIYDTPEDLIIERLLIRQRDRQAQCQYSTTYDNISNNEHYIIYPKEGVLVVNGHAEILVDIETLKRLH